MLLEFFLKLHKFGVFLFSLLLIPFFLVLTGFSFCPGFGSKRFTEANQAGEGADVLSVIKEQLVDCIDTISPARITKPSYASQSLSNLPLVSEMFADDKSNSNSGAKVGTSHN